MLPDAEVLKVCTEILSALPIGAFTIKLNHRKLLDASLALAGIPSAKFRTVCSSIDKLDKEPWSAVREELIGEKGISPAAAEAVGRLVQRSGRPQELLAALQAEGTFAAQEGGRAALEDLGLVFKYLEAMGALQCITLDLSLARGLDYYTGLIYEAVLLDPSVGVGSIAAGGRYDGLVGMFSASGAAVPCVGVSIGVERVFTIMEAAAAAAEGGLKRTPVALWVASIPSSRGKDMALERMRLLGELWSLGFSAEALAGAGDPKLQKQLTAANDAGCPFALVLGEDELDAGTVQLKALHTKESHSLRRADLLAELLGKGVQQLKMGVTV
jgi:histidyl-tRNA synthetase